MLGRRARLDPPFERPFDLPFEGPFDLPFERPFDLPFDFATGVLLACLRCLVGRRPSPRILRTEVAGAKACIRGAPAPFGSPAARRDLRRRRSVDATVGA